MNAGVRQALRSVVRRAAAMEARVVGPRSPRFVPVFIVGPPRSGTTLLYQAACAGLRVAYPTNLMVEGGLETAPHLYRALARLLGRRMEVLDFTSEHGRTRGPGSPHEAGALWNRWFDDTHHLRPGAETAMKTAIACIEEVFEAPFVNKNVMHVPRLVALAGALPTARFVEVRRDLAATARSIERARVKAGATTAWWSVKPSNTAELLGLSLADQARGQVLGVQADLARARAVVGAERFFEVEYEALCAAPRTVLDDLARWWGVGTRLERLPERFDARG